MEGMLAGAVSDNDKNLTISGVPSNVNAKLDYMYGIWLKPQYFYLQAEAFARVG